MALEQLKQEFEHLLQTGDNLEIRQFLDEKGFKPAYEAFKRGTLIGKA